MKIRQEIVFYEVSVVLRSVGGWWIFEDHTSLCTGHNPGMHNFCEDISLMNTPSSQMWNSASHA